MLAYNNLENAVLSLNKSVSNFPIGAVSLDDFKPIEEKISDTRKLLKRLTARLLWLKAKTRYVMENEEPEDEIERTIEDLQTETVRLLQNDRAFKLMSHSYTIQEILAGRQGDANMQEKIYAYMRKLFTLNDTILSLQKDIENAVKKQVKLKIQCQNALFDYKKFLKEQEEICSKKLQETNPEIALNKEKTNKSLRNINIMKKLIVNLISASHFMLMENPHLIEMLEKHRETINIETILKMSQGDTDQERAEAQA
ncbi:uncharacterized protein LOC100877647 [Megachile rotundata]|uniref:uncharacterized protein LOC100877647 n=1 Tax=Megachile rotundata TaxID=143995 RepID=UPI000258DDF4|nr:PREDICTED: uncharacterized protein LOC100877647 [Megachile rotundata]